VIDGGGDYSGDYNGDYNGDTNGDNDKIRSIYADDCGGMGVDGGDEIQLITSRNTINETSKNTTSSVDRADTLNQPAMTINHQSHPVGHFCGPTGGFPSQGTKVDDLRKRHADLHCEYEHIVANQIQDRHSMCTPQNKQKIDRLLQTFGLIKEHVGHIERAAAEDYKSKLDEMSNNIMYAGDSVIARLTSEVTEDRTNCLGKRKRDNNDQSATAKHDTLNHTDYRNTNWMLEQAVLERFKARVTLEVKSLEYLNNCENSYVYAKYTMLLIIANETDVCRQVEHLSDPKKFRNFPLYLQLLSREMENAPFNTHNATLVIKDFVKAASYYYTLGMVKPKLAESLYNHPNYMKF